MSSIITDLGGDTEQFRWIDNQRATGAVINYNSKMGGAHPIQEFEYNNFSISIERQLSSGAGGEHLCMPPNTTSRQEPDMHVSLILTEIKKKPKNRGNGPQQQRWSSGVKDTVS